MAKKRKKKKVSASQRKAWEADKKRFMASLIKLHERLTIVLDHNLSVKQDPSEQDIKLLDELYAWYDASEMPWIRDEELVEQIVSQAQLFSANQSD